MRRGRAKSTARKAQRSKSRPPPRTKNNRIDGGLSRNGYTSGIRDDSGLRTLFHTSPEAETLLNNPFSLTNAKRTPKRAPKLHRHNSTGDIPTSPRTPNPNNPESPRRRAYSLQPSPRPNQQPVFTFPTKKITPRVPRHLRSPKTRGENQAVKPIPQVRASRARRRKKLRSPVQDVPTDPTPKSYVTPKGFTPKGSWPSGSTVDYNSGTAFQRLALDCWNDPSAPIPARKRDRHRLHHSQVKPFIHRFLTTTLTRTQVLLDEMANDNHVASHLRTFSLPKIQQCIELYEQDPEIMTSELIRTAGDLGLQRFLMSTPRLLLGINSSVISSIGKTSKRLRRDMESEDASVKLLLADREELQAQVTALEAEFERKKDEHDRQLEAARSRLRAIFEEIETKSTEVQKLSAERAKLVKHTLKLRRAMKEDAAENQSRRKTVKGAHCKIMVKLNKETAQWKPSDYSDFDEFTTFLHSSFPTKWIVTQEKEKGKCMPIENERMLAEQIRMTPPNSSVTFRVFKCELDDKERDIRRLEKKVTKLKDQIRFLKANDNAGQISPHKKMRKASNSEMIRNRNRTLTEKRQPQPQDNYPIYASSSEGQDDASEYSEDGSQGQTTLHPKQRTPSPKKQPSPRRRNPRGSRSSPPLPKALLKSPTIQTTKELWRFNTDPHDPAYLSSSDSEVQRLMKDADGTVTDSRRTGREEEEASADVVVVKGSAPSERSEKRRKTGKKKKKMSSTFDDLPAVPMSPKDMKRDARKKSKRHNPDPSVIAFGKMARPRKSEKKGSVFTVNTDLSGLSLASDMSSGGVGPSGQQPALHRSHSGDDLGPGAGAPEAGLSSRPRGPPRGWPGERESASATSRIDDFAKGLNLNSLLGGVWPKTKHLN